MHREVMRAETLALQAISSQSDQLFRSICIWLYKLCTG